MLGNGAYIFSSTGLDDIILGINAQWRRSMRSQGLCICPHLAADFFVRSFVSLIFLECPFDTLFWSYFRTKPPPPTSLLSLSYLLVYCLPPVTLLLCTSPLLLPPQIRIWSSVRGGRLCGSGGGNRRIFRPDHPCVTPFMLPPQHFEDTYKLLVCFWPPQISVQVGSSP